MKTRFGISGGMLKWIAIILMAVDHIGASVLENFMLNARGTSPLGGYFYGNWTQIYQVDQVIRLIGRPAFPVFCFLLIEGFVHTHNVKKYAVRLGIFALVSEIPFDLALYNQIWSWHHQNVFFTLLIGLLVLWIIRIQEERIASRRRQRPSDPAFRIFFQSLPEILLMLLAVFAGVRLAGLIHTDYGEFGVAFIIVLYAFRRFRIIQCIMGALCIAWEYTAPLAFLFILFYNGERGWQPKWFFYWFYPLHLLLYYLIGAWILPTAVGLAGIAGLSFLGFCDKMQLSWKGMS